MPSSLPWTSALALFVYAAGFSFAYVSLSAATGALQGIVAYACGRVHGLAVPPAHHRLDERP